MTDERFAGVTDQMLHRIRREYLEMPGLCLTLEQAQRLWGLDEATCRDAMQRLVETRFLCRTVGGVIPSASPHTFCRPLVAAQPDRKAA